MKKSITLFSTIALLIACASLTSCDNGDVEESIILSGQWRGDWGMFYEIEHRGRIYRFDSYDTDIVFYPDHDYATHGYGYQVDWYDFGPYERLSFCFEWSVDRGIVNIYYPEYNTFIRDYHLSGDYFSGYLGNRNTWFSLGKIRDFYNWGYYSQWNYHPWEYSGWSWDYYYGRTTRSANDEEPTLSTEDKIIKIGSRYTE